MMRTSLLLAFIGHAVAHMGISSLGSPGGKSRSQVAFGDSFRYPNAGVCHGVNRIGDVTQIISGQTYRAQTSFGASHDGGHCVWAVSVDDGNTYYKLNDVKDCTMMADHELPIPTNLPTKCQTDSCLLSWFWTPVSSGSCEIYQNCFDIKVSIATGGIENTAPTFSHAVGNELSCRRVDPNTHFTTHYGRIIGSGDSGDGGVGTPPPTFSTLPPTMPLTPPPTLAPPPTPYNDECVSHAQLIAINAESSYWPSCDPSQPSKGQATNREFGFYCTREWATSLNNMLKAVGYCNNPLVIRNFLAQAAYETGYFSTLGQPLDNGSGVIHMIPSNWLPNARDMAEEFQDPSLLTDFKSRSAQGQKEFFKEPDKAWLSAAAWFKNTNRVIPGCGKDLFPLSLDEQTECILGRVVPRDEALRLVSKHIPLNSSPTPPPSALPTPPPTQTIPPTPLPTRPPTVAPAPTPSDGGDGSGSGCDSSLPTFSTTTTYWAGDRVQYEGKEYLAGYWSRGPLPTAGAAWTLEKICDPASSPCGGLPEWSTSVAYSGGALVNYQDKVFRAKWWSKSTPPPQADSWAFQNVCEDFEDVSAGSYKSLSDAVVVGQENADTKYSAFIQLELFNLPSSVTAASLDQVLQDFESLMYVQYSVFLPETSIKAIQVIEADNGDIDVIVEVQFDSMEDAIDAAAVLKNYESSLVSTFEQLAVSYDLDIAGHIALKSHSGAIAVVDEDGASTSESIDDVDDGVANSAHMSSPWGSLTCGFASMLVALMAF